jgi:hypothetical protein
MTLDQAVALFTKELPGWWWSVGDCEISAHASCGPNHSGPDGNLIDIESTVFDSGFHVDLRQPSAPAQALLNVLKCVSPSRPPAAMIKLWDGNCRAREFWNRLPTDVPGNGRVVS